MNNVRPGVALFVVNRNYEALMLQRKSDSFDDKKWCLPGGGIEWGEDIWSALVREANEEAGLDLSDYINEIEQVAADTCFYPEFNTYHLTVYGVVFVEDNELLATAHNAEPNKSYGVKWVPLDEIRNQDLAFADTVGVTEFLIERIINIIGEDNEDCDCEFCQDIAADPLDDEEDYVCDCEHCLGLYPADEDEDEDGCDCPYCTGEYENGDGFVETIERVEEYYERTVEAPVQPTVVINIDTININLG